ncbi:MAG: PH domain-containing protein [Phycisphaerales bacterium]
MTTLTAMGSEEILWTGRTSQIVNWHWFLACLLVLPIPVAIYNWLRVRFCVFELTSERIIKREGILSRSTSYLELYRVRDISLAEPLIYRMIGCGNLVLQTSDRSHPSFTFNAIGQPRELESLLRHQVEQMRATKNVREVDFE